MKLIKSLTNTCDNMQLANKIIELLKHHPEEKFTARQIAEWIYKTYPDECLQKQARSDAKIYPLDSESSLVQQIAAEVASQRPRLQKRFSQIKTTEGRPRKYYFTEKEYDEEIIQAESLMTGTLPKLFNEHALYPMLKKFLLNEFNIYSKRIDEKRSSNAHGKGGNKWLYPDLVGIEDLSADWKAEVKDCVTQYADKKTRLWSFEVKVLINRSNIREAFFQAVSNSSWANVGYLVTSSLEGTDTEKELRILFGLHGIGLILLNIENPTESQILIPARERNTIDWDTANRLAEENKDFLEYIKLVSDFYKLGKIREIDWQDVNESFSDNK